MKLSELKSHLNELEELHFTCPDGSSVPAHFHVTEIGLIEKNYIDCGGSIRKEQKVSFQLWVAEDTDHRLKAQKLQGIINQAAPLLGQNDPEIEVEYQQATIGKFHLDFNEGKFLLKSTYTDCLAKDNCGIPEDKKPKVNLSDLKVTNKQGCKPGSGCC